MLWLHELCCALLGVKLLVTFQSPSIRSPPKWLLERGGLLIPLSRCIYYQRGDTLFNTYYGLAIIVLCEMSSSLHWTLQLPILLSVIAYYCVSGCSVLLSNSDAMLCTSRVKWNWRRQQIFGNKRHTFYDSSKKQNENHHLTFSHNFMKVTISL